MPSHVSLLLGFAFAIYLAIRPTDKVVDTKDSLDREHLVATSCFESAMSTLNNRTNSNQDLNYFMRCLVIETGEAEPSMLKRIDINEVHKHIVDLRKNVEQGECASK